MTEVASAITLEVCCTLSTVSTFMADNCSTILDFICDKNDVNVTCAVDGAQHTLYCRGMKRKGLGIAGFEINRKT